MSNSVDLNCLFKISSKINEYNMRKENIRNHGNSHNSKTIMPAFEVNSKCYGIENDLNVVDHEKINEIIDQFNEFYRTYGGMISKHYEESYSGIVKLHTLYDCMYKVWSRYYSSDVSNARSVCDYEFVAVILRKIVQEMERLLYKSEELERRLEQQRVEIEQQKKIEEMEQQQKRQQEEMEQRQKRQQEEMEQRQKMQQEMEQRQKMQQEEMEQRQKKEQMQKTHVEMKQMSQVTQPAVLPVHHNELRKVINNICSQVTTANPGHTLTRISELGRLLTGHSIRVPGGSSTVAATDDSSKELCWRWLTEATLGQAHSQFVASLESAAVFGAVLHSVMSGSEERLHQLVKGLVERHPDLWPSSPDPRRVDLGDNEEEASATRGAARLLGCLLVSRPAPGHPEHPGIGPALLWRLLADHCSSQHPSSLAAEACLGLLEAGGSQLMRCYGRQASKMFLAIEQLFLPCPGVSELALAIFVQQARTSGKFEHDSCLPDAFWTSPGQ